MQAVRWWQPTTGRGGFQVSWCRTLTGALAFEQVDIAVPGALLAIAKKHNVDSIVHLAIHGQALQDPGEDLRANMDSLRAAGRARDSGVGALACPA